jgi:hypothetical protein
MLGVGAPHRGGMGSSFVDGKIFKKNVEIEYGFLIYWSILPVY